jgi:transposase
MNRRAFLASSASLALSTRALAGGRATRVVVWDERQPEQKRAYDDFLGNQIAGHLRTLPGLTVRSVALADPEQGMPDDLLADTDVLVWWGHVKNDRFDARTLAELLAVDLIPRVWITDEATRALRRLTSRRAQLVRQRTRVKNEATAVLVRNLKGRPPASDLFGKRGRQWLTELELPLDERDTVAACLRQIDFLTVEIAGVDEHLAKHAFNSTEIRRLMTIPGVDVTTAATLMAAIGDIRRFASAKRLVGYLGLDARVRQSGVSAARHGHISKEGTSAARHVLVQAAWAAIKTPGPLRAFYQRIKARRGAQIAIVAVARKLAMLCWQLLTTEQDYAYQRPTLVARKLRTLELRAGAPHATRTSTAPRASTAKQRAANERQLGEHAEHAYRRLVADWKATAPNKGAGAAPGRASQRPSSDQAARQAPAPEPAL